MRLLGASLGAIVFLNSNRLRRPQMQFQNQEAINNNIKTIKSTITRYNNWAAKYEALSAQRAIQDTLSLEERNDLVRAWGKLNDYKPKHPRYGSEAYRGALITVPRALEAEHGIVIQNSPSNGGCEATAKEILAVFGMEV